VARRLILAVLLVAALLPVSGAGGADAQAPKRGGTVVVAANSLSEPACLGWLEACDPVGWAAPWLEKVLARPFVAGPHRLRNHLVARYELTKDPFTVTFRIRPQARWSDGVPVSAQDFVFAYDTFLAHAGYPDDDPLRADVRRPRAVDGKTVRFEFRARYGDWRALLNFPPLPGHALRGADLASTSVWRDRIEDPRTGGAIGSGPFLVERWERGKQLTLVRNPRYWGPHKAHLDRVVVRFVRGPATVEAMRSGEFDVGVTLPPTPQLENDSRFRLLPTRWASWEHYEIRVGPGGHPALKNKLVRQAIAYGIDRGAIARDLFGASAPPVLDSTMYLPSEKSYEPNWSRYRYRPAEARRLLERAGCSRGSDGVYSCAGERLRLRFVTSAGVPFRARNLELVTTQLRRVGVEVDPSFAPNALLFETILPSGEFDVALFGLGKPSPESLENTYRCDESFTGRCNRLVNADYDQLDRIVLPSRRVAVANRIDRRLVTEVPALPLFQTPLTYVVRKGVEGVVPNGFGALTTGGVFWNAETWWLDD
jgi:peptide/nickel transport system substrate-binding protein